MAGTAETDMAIGGLSEEQCEVLRGVKVGSLIEVAVFTRPNVREVQEESGDEGESEDEEGEDDEGEVSGDEHESEGSAGEVDDEGQASGSDDEDVSEEPDSPDTPDATNQPTSTLADLKTPEHFAQVLANLDLPLNGRTEDSASDGDRADDVNTGADTAGPDAVVLGSAAGVAATGAAAVASGQDTNEAAEGVTEGDGESDGEGSNSDDEEQDEGESNEGSGEGGESEEEDEEQYYPRELSRVLYVVTQVETETDDGDDSKITDLHVRRLYYQNVGDAAHNDTYRIYGDAITLSTATQDDNGNDEVPESFAAMVAEQPQNNFTTTLNPSGSAIRRALFGGRCPARCHRGWLADQNALKDLVDDQIQDLEPYRPLCPVCLGKDLMNEQILLRGLLDAMHIVDIGMVVEYLGRLNPRRRALGYRFVQFDEREWGYGFDDMLDEGRSDAGGGNDAGQFEQWDEAMDPNANPKTRPAGKATVAALPRKTYAEVQKQVEGVCCAICHDGVFEPESHVVDLPCGHVYDVACLEAWIGQYDNCPECRGTVSGMVGAKGETDGEDEGAEKEQGEEDLVSDAESLADVEDSVELALQRQNQEPLIVVGGGGGGLGFHGPVVDEPEMDGEDTVMSDAG